MDRNQINRQLSRFGNFLLQQQMVAPGKEKFFVSWVRGYLNQEAFFKGRSWQEKLPQYIALLSKRQNIKPWQLTQAEQAVRLYFNNFHVVQKKSIENITPGQGRVVQNLVDRGQALADLKEWLRIKHYAYKTEQSYLNWCKRFFSYCDECQGADNIGQIMVNPELIRDFLSQLASRHKVAKSTQNQAFSALLFLCRNVLHIELKEMEKNLRSKPGKKLPVVLSPEEVKQLLSHLSGTMGLILRLIYSSGMRLSECARLRVKDLDFEQGLIFVRSGKGDKDRSTILAQSIQGELQTHLAKVKTLHKKDIAEGFGKVYMPGALNKKYPSACQEIGWQYVFPSARLSVDPRSKKTRRHHISDAAIQKAMKKAVQKTGIIKPASVHTLRHSFATHLLLNGVDIRQIQDYLGHKSVETTMIYTHVVKNMRNPAISPLDMLEQMTSG